MFAIYEKIALKHDFYIIIYYNKETMKLEYQAFVYPQYNNSVKYYISKSNPTAYP